MSRGRKHRLTVWSQCCVNQAQSPQVQKEVLMNRKPLGDWRKTQEDEEEEEDKDDDQRTKKKQKKKMKMKNFFLFQQYQLIQLLAKKLTRGWIMFMNQRDKSFIIFVAQTLAAVSSSSKADQGSVEQLLNETEQWLISGSTSSATVITGTEDGDQRTRRTDVVWTIRSHLASDDFTLNLFMKQLRVDGLN